MQGAVETLMTANGDITAGAPTDTAATIAATTAVADALKARGATVATAESCTGGRVAAALTAAAGASEYFMGGVVAYSNEVKVAALGVGRETLERHGAVSGEVALEMALGALCLTGARYAVATTGIAGPGGGSPAKPVGTVWIAVADGSDRGDEKTGVTARCFRFTGTRTQIMAAAVRAALDMLREVTDRRGN